VSDRLFFFVRLDALLPPSDLFLVAGCLGVSVLVLSSFPFFSHLALSLGMWTMPGRHLFPPPHVGLSDHGPVPPRPPRCTALTLCGFCFFFVYFFGKISLGPPPIILTSHHVLFVFLIFSLFLVLRCTFFFFGRLNALPFGRPMLVRTRRPLSSVAAGLLAQFLYLGHGRPVSILWLRGSHHLMLFFTLSHPPVQKAFPARPL